MEHRTLQIGAAALAFALLLRLGTDREKGIWELGNTLLFLSTGRMITETVPAETTVSSIWFIRYAVVSFMATRDRLGFSMTTSLPSFPRILVIVRGSV